MGHKRRQIEQIQMEKQVFMAKQTLSKSVTDARNRANQIKLQDQKVLKSLTESTPALKKPKIDVESVKKSEVEPGFEDADNWGDEDDEENMENENPKNYSEDQLKSEVAAKKENLLNAGKQKTWLKFIELAKQTNRAQNDLMVVSYLAQTMGHAVTYPNEKQGNGKWFIDCRITDILIATGSGLKKKDAKRVAAENLLKLILTRHDDEATRFVF